MSSIQLRKILVIRLSSIGDVILTTPMLRVLKAGHPGCVLHFLTRKEFGELLRNDPHIDRLITIDTAGGRSALRALNLSLMEERYDAVFDLHNNFRSRVLRNGVGPRVHGINKRSVRRLLLYTLHVNCFGEITAVPDRYIETAKRYGLRPDTLGPRLHPSGAQRTDARLKLRAAGADPSIPSIGLCPGARHFTKRWPAVHFASLARMLAGRGERVLLFGSSDDGDAAATIIDAAATIIDAVPASAAGLVTDMTGKLSLMETAAAMEFCRAVVANDSGLMHMATAVLRPVVALFGSTVREFGFFPYHSSAVVLERDGLRCRPCSHIGRAECPKRHFACLRDISPDQALDALDSFDAPDSSTTADNS